MKGSLDVSRFIGSVTLVVGLIVLALSVYFLYDFRTLTGLVLMAVSVFLLAQAFSLLRLSVATSSRKKSSSAGEERPPTSFNSRSMIVPSMLVLSMLIASLAPCVASPPDVLLRVEVRDSFGNDLPNQFVQVFGGTQSNQSSLVFQGYTPTTENPSVLTIPISGSVLSSFTHLLVRTANLTQLPGVDLASDWQLDPQWLSKTLSVQDVETNPDLTLAWSTKLQLTIYAGDGARYLHNAWVFMVDAVTGDNVTAALTDDAGYPNSIDITDPTLTTTWASDQLATGEPPGSRLNLGFNLLEGKYIVRIFWKAPGAGAVLPYGKVEGVSVWDTFRDQPQHRYIYLGIDLPPTSTGENNAPAQVRTLSTKVYDLKLTVLDQSPSAKTIASTPVVITAPDASPAWVMHATTSAAGEVMLTLVPAGKYQVVATSPNALYGKPASQIIASAEATVIDAATTISVLLPVFDVNVILVTPSGKPMVDANVTIGGVVIGKTDTLGEVLAASIASGSYTVTANWYGLDISPTVPLTVTLSRAYLLTAGRMALVQILVVGAQGEGLPGAAVTIKTGTTTVFTGMANNDGVVAVELPYGTYGVMASYKGVEASVTLSVTSDTSQSITVGGLGGVLGGIIGGLGGLLGGIIGMIGLPQTPEGMLLLLVLIVVVLLQVVIIAFIWRRRRTVSKARE
jgi:hypothetical protein